MRLTTKGRFAVTAMIDLALREAERPVTLAGISERQHISLSYLEQLFGKLRKNGLVESIRGPGGGYILPRPMDKITVADIVTAVDEPTDAVVSAEQEMAPDDQRCTTNDLWSSLNLIILEFLRSITLRDLVEKQRGKETASGDNQGVRVMVVRGGVKQYVTA